MSDALDSDSPTPLWQQVADILTAEIQAGRLTGRVPSEADLMQTYGIARNTARRAFRHLREEGLITTTPGRGTFVAP